MRGLFSVLLKYHRTLSCVKFPVKCSGKRRVHKSILDVRDWEKSTHQSLFRAHNLRKTNQLTWDNRSLWIPFNRKLEVLCEMDLNHTYSMPSYRLMGNNPLAFTENLEIDKNVYFLGYSKDSTPYYTINPDIINEEKLLESKPAKFVNYRTLFSNIEPLNVSIIAQAKSLLHFHTSSKFCPKCGGNTKCKYGGASRTCEKCDTEHYPRTDPCVIMLIHHNNTHALLGRQATWDKGRYSVLAGFMDVGENVEDGVSREVFEETGILVERPSISYFGSQSFPFPSSLMIACFGKAQSRDIRVDKAELEDAIWVSREEVKRIIEGDTKGLPITSLPMIGAISYKLIHHWAHHPSKFS